MTDLLWIFLYKRIKDKSHSSKNLIFHAKFFNILRIFFKNYILLDPLTFKSNNFLIDWACSSALYLIYLILHFCFQSFCCYHSLKLFVSDLLSLTIKYIFSKFTHSAFHLLYSEEIANCFPTIITVASWNWISAFAHHKI